MVQIRDTAYMILENYLAACNVQEILLGLPALEEKRGELPERLEDEIRYDLKILLR